MDELYDKIYSQYPELVSSIQLSREHLLFFDESGLSKLEVRLQSDGHTIYIEVFEYDKKLPEKSLWGSTKTTTHKDDNETI
jgi:hypothetical protein